MTIARKHGLRDRRVPAFRKSTVASVLSAALMAGTVPAVHGAAEFKLGDDAGVTAGIGLRTSFASQENATPNGSNSKDFVIDNARLFFSGHYGKVIKATLNTDYNSTTDSLIIMDAYVGFEFNDYFNIWLGRHLPPQDRANGYGPFYTLPWTYPIIASNYPFRENGRDNGVTFWGKLAGGKFVWAGGAYEGHNKYSGSSTPVAAVPATVATPAIPAVPITAASASDKLAYSGRLIFNVWDNEPAPAYLAGGWFGGAKDLLTFGLGGYTQQDGTGPVTNPGRLRIWNVDVLFEKKFAPGVPTLEGAYYDYKTGTPDCGAGAACPVNTNTQQNLNLPQSDGKAWLLGAAWLFPQKVGWGQFQPFYRYQKFDPSAAGGTDTKWQDLGLNYIIKGPNAKVSAQYTKMDNGPGNEPWRFVLGVQLIY